MSRYKDAGQLALTKLKTRRIRLAVTIFISSILFCLLLALTFTVNGTIKSIEKFRGTGFSSRYIVSAYSVISPYDFLSDPSLVSKAQELQKKTVARKKAEAKRLGIEYDSATDIQYVSENDQGPGGKVKQINTQVPEVGALLAQKLKDQPGSRADFEKQTKQFGATATYSSVYIGSGDITSGPPSFPYLKPLNKGKEGFNQQDANNPKGFGGDMNSIDSLGSQWQLFSKDLLKPFIMENQSLDIGKDGSIPIIAPYSAVEKMIGLKPLSATASSKERLERLKEVRTKSAGYKVDICYRNSVSSDQIQQALQQQQEITSNKSKKDYKMPDLVYDVPKDACGAVRITRDVRSATQKKYDANEALFKKEFGEPAPQSKILHLRIAGINSDMPTGGSISVTEIFQTILISSLGQGWSSPLELTSKEPALAAVFGVSGTGNAPEQSFTQTQYAEFKSAGEVEKVLTEQNCEPDFDPQASQQPFKKCIAVGKYFGYSPFGSSSVALDHFKKGFDKFFLIAGLVISGIAAIILMGTVGRVIADSRKETAVFRAIGAKRLDIAQVYLIYTVMLALLIAFTSTLFGYLISRFISNHYSPTITVNALVAFNVPDLNQRFSMSSLYLKDIFYITILIILAAILASLLPLLTNLRRNPINDMRDER